MVLFISYGFLYSASFAWKIFSYLKVLYFYNRFWSYFWIIVDLICMKVSTVHSAETTFKDSKMYSLIACLSTKVNCILLSCIHICWQHGKTHLCSFHSSGDISMLVLTRSLLLHKILFHKTVRRSKVYWVSGEL